MSFTFEDMKEKIKFGINYGNALECFNADRLVMNKKKYNMEDDNGIVHPISYEFLIYTGKIDEYDPVESYVVWSTEGIWGNPETTKELIEYYASIGFTAMRLPVNLWWHYNAGTSTMDPQWISYIRSVVEMIIDAGMFCLLDVHCENYSAVFKDSFDDYADLDNSAIFARLLNRWNILAEALKDIPEDKLAFELLNEFNFGRIHDVGSEYMEECKLTARIYDKLITKVRETGGYNINRLIGIDGYRGDNGITARNIESFSDILKDKRNFVCATGYLLSEFTFCYTQSYGKKTFLKEPTFDYDKERVNNDMWGLITLADAGYNVVVVEYGTHAYDSFTGTDEEVDTYRDGCVDLTLLESLWCDKLSIPAFVWDTGYIIDRNNISIKSPELYDAVFRNADQEKIDYLTSVIKK